MISVTNNLRTLSHGAPEAGDALRPGWDVYSSYIKAQNLYSYESVRELEFVQ